MEIEPEKQRNPWLSLWFQPRATLRYLIRYDKRGPLFWLALILGLLNGTASSLLTWGKYAQLTFYGQFSGVVTHLALGVVLAFFYLYLMSWLYALVGSWVKGEGTFRTLFLAIGWSYYLWIAAAIIGFLPLLPYTTAEIQGVGALLYTLSSLWALIATLKLIAEAHRFSAWRAVLTVALTLLLLLGVTLLIGALFTLLKFF